MEGDVIGDINQGVVVDGVDLLLDRVVHHSNYFDLPPQLMWGLGRSREHSGLASVSSMVPSHVGAVPPSCSRCRQGGTL